MQQSRGVGASTINRRASILRAAYNWATRSRHIPTNPLSGLRLKKVEPQRITPPSAHEARLIYRAAAPHIQRVVLLGMALGPRIGPSELFRLEWSRVDVYKRQVSDFRMAGEDAVRVVAVGREQALLDVRVTEAMHGEPADVVARRLLASTGLPVAEIRIPSEVLPHIVFSGVTVAMAVKQLAWTLETSFGHDMSKHAVWLGEAGLYLSLIHILSGRFPRA